MIPTVGQRLKAKRNLYNETGMRKGRREMARKGEEVLVIAVPFGFEVHGRIVVRGLDNEFAADAQSFVRTK